MFLCRINLEGEEDGISALLEPSLLRMSEALFPTDMIKAIDARVGGLAEGIEIAKRWKL